jgi:hypothetical protein
MPINMGQRQPRNATSLGLSTNGHTHPHRLTESWILSAKVVDQPIKLSSQLCCCTILAPPSDLERHLYTLFPNRSDIIFEQAPMTHIGLLLPLLGMNKSSTWSCLKVSSPLTQPSCQLVCLRFANPVDCLSRMAHPSMTAISTAHGSLDVSICSRICLQEKTTIVNIF